MSKEYKLPPKNTIGVITSEGITDICSKFLLTNPIRKPNKAKEKQTGITNLLQDLKDSGLKLRDLKTEQNNLEKIFVTLVKENNEI